MVYSSAPRRDVRRNRQTIRVGLGGLALVLVLGCSPTASGGGGTGGGTDGGADGGVLAGTSCAPQRPGGQTCTAGDGGSPGCFRGTEVYIEVSSSDCRAGVCVVYRYAEADDPTGAARSDHVYCTCRCGVPPSLSGTSEAEGLCACGGGFSCVSLAGEQYGPAVRGSYCVRTGTVSP